MCVGICVLLAIVYVLSRTGTNQEALMDRNTNNGNVNQVSTIGGGGGGGGSSTLSLIHI